jgi:hypothetical protein
MHRPVDHRRAVALRFGLISVLRLGFHGCGF